jgi:hypothetical protein
VVSIAQPKRQRQLVRAGGFGMRGLQKALDYGTLYGLFLLASVALIVRTSKTMAK